jgi:methyl-accepting chemotaxis protein
LNGLHDRLSLARIDKETLAALPDLWRAIEPALPDLMGAFYAHMKSFPQSAALIKNQDSRLISAQSRHWKGLFSGNFDQTYAASIRRIGEAHHRIGLEPHVYITSYQFMVTELSRYLLKSSRFTTERLAKQLDALNKIVFLDMSLALDAYYDVLKEAEARATKRVRDAVHTFETSVGQVLTSLDDRRSVMQETAVTLANTAKETAVEGQEASIATKSTSENVQAVAAATEQLSASIREIAQQLSGTSEVVRHAKEATMVTSNNAERLSEASGRIASVVSLINAISRQTNLLALNATIEAARAGEAGKGFAVVAQEVKALSAQTAKATDEIAQQIAAIQAATTSSVQSIEDISETIKMVEERTSSIAAAAEEQNAATQEIARNVSLAATATDGLSRNVEKVTEAISMTERSSNTVIEASKALEDQAGVLSEHVRAFLKALWEGSLDRREGDNPQYKGPERRSNSADTNKAAAA